MRLGGIYDGDRFDNEWEVTIFKTEQNQYKWRCGMCREVLFVDKNMFESLKKALERSLGNQFICKDCQKDYDKFSFESRVALL